MKKIFSVAFVATAAALMVSCGNTNPKAKLKNGLDSLSYAYGVKQSDGLIPYIEDQAHIDSIYMSEFYKGIVEGFNAGNDKKRNAYIWGLQIGQRVNMMLVSNDAMLLAKDSASYLSRENYLAGFINGAQDKDIRLTPKEIDSLINYIGRHIADQNREKEAQLKRQSSVDFIAQKAKEAGVQKLPSGVLYKVIKAGEGEKPSAKASVKVRYEGKLPDGTVFDSSAKRGDEPVQFRVSQVIKGWSEALVNMPVGSKWQLFIPEDLAYGERGIQGVIPPYSALDFTVELVEIEEPQED